MRRVSLFVAIAFLAGLAIGFFARRASLSTLHRTDAADLAAIKKLEQEDIDVENEKFREQFPEFRVLKYAPVVTEVQIAGGWAIEVGNADAVYRMSAKDEPVSVNETGSVRMLKRQSDGSWKFAVVGLK